MNFIIMSDRVKKRGGGGGVYFPNLFANRNIGGSLEVDLFLNTLMPTTHFHAHSQKTDRALIRASIHWVFWQIHCKATTTPAATPTVLLLSSPSLYGCLASQ